MSSANTALASAAIGALLAMAFAWHKPLEPSPWSRSVVAGGAYRQQIVEKVEVPAIVRAASAVAWLAVVVSFLRGLGLAMELGMMGLVVVSGAGHVDCATFPCDGYAPPPPPPPDETMSIVVNAAYLVAVGALIGALASWALHAPKDVMTARRLEPLAACGLVVAVVAVDVISGARHLGVARGLAPISIVHASFVVAAAALLLLARQEAQRASLGDAADTNAPPGARS